MSGRARLSQKLTHFYEEEEIRVLALGGRP